MHISDSGVFRRLGLILAVLLSLHVCAVDAQPLFTLNKWPSPYQLFARGSNDQATIPIDGSFVCAAGRCGDAVIVRLSVFRNQQLLFNLDLKRFIYNTEKYTFNFAPSITAELATFR